MNILSFFKSENKAAPAVGDTENLKTEGFKKKKFLIGGGGVAIATIALLLTLRGCSAQRSGRLFGSMTDIPEAPKNALVELGTSTEDDGLVFVSYLVWNKSKNTFEINHVQYTTSKFFGLTNAGDFDSAGGYRQKIRDGMTIAGVGVIDQKNKLVNFLDGRKLSIQADGHSYKIFSNQEALLTEGVFK